MSGELDARIEALAAAEQALRAQIECWPLTHQSMMPDTSLFIQHQEKLESFLGLRREIRRSRGMSPGPAARQCDPLGSGSPGGARLAIPCHWESPAGAGTAARVAGPAPHGAATAAAV